MEAVCRKVEFSKIIADEEANIFPRKKKFVTSWSKCLTDMMWALKTFVGEMSSRRVQRLKA
jgi:hypothetical protein